MDELPGVENLDDADQFILGRDFVRNFELSDSKQVCLVPNPNSQSSVFLGRSFSVTRNGLCVSVLLNTLDTTVSIQRGKKLGYALPMRTDYEETENSKKNIV